jgi:hypothetical protein
VTQRCEADGQLATCRYYYAEMPDDGLFEVRRLPNGGSRSASTAISCLGGYPAFFAPGVPVDFGARLLGLAKTTVPTALLEQRVYDALGTYVVSAAGLFGIRLSGNPTPLGQPHRAGGRRDLLLHSRVQLGHDRHVTAETAVWVNLWAAALGSPSERGERALRVVLGKTGATVQLARLLSKCTEQIAEATEAGQLELIPLYSNIILSAPRCGSSSSLGLASLGWPPRCPSGSTASSETCDRRQWL